ncbi:MAG: Gfo/Idh/MocA family oxidoreductase [Thermoguttaceae bacterium]|nr:Gfo/Idh/MocA family oxidoreductase [Thermoguttaceae bacterium]
MKNISRRRFIGDSLFAMTAAMAAQNSFSSSSLLRAQDAESVSPNEIMNVMIVGCGGRGNGHLEQYLTDPRTQITYVCDPDSQHAEAYAARIAEKQEGLCPKVVADMREAFDDDSLDIVSCASCNHWHALCGVWAMQKGKHVYIEKPISHNIHEGKALIAAAKKYDCMCQVGSQCRSTPAVVAATQFVAEGGIGEVKLTRGLCYKRRKSIGALGEYAVPETVDYNLWSGPAPIVDPPTRPNFHYDWHWQRLYGNGDLGNQGPHQTDIARIFLGETEFPSSVLSYGGRLGYQVERNDENYIDAGDTANTEVSIYNYADGKTLVFETRGLETEPYRGAEIGVIAYGSEGYMVQVNYGYCVAYDLNGQKMKEFKGGSDQPHFDNFISAVVNHDYSSLNADARCGHLSASLSHLGNISYYLGENNKVSVDEARKVLADYPGNDDSLDTLNRTVEHLQSNNVDLDKYPLAMGVQLKIDPKKEVFIDNADANRMEGREYRGEFVVPSAEEV